MANAYTIKETPEAADSITISDVTGQIFRATLGSLPGSSSAVGGYVDPPVYSDSSGIKGQYSFDADYVYMCIADNSWDRFPVTWDAWGASAPENPVVLSATIDVSGEILTIVFDRNVFQGSAYLDSDFNLDASMGGSDISVTYIIGDGTDTHVYEIGTIISAGETVNLDYNGRPEGIKDAAGNDLGAVLNFDVSNNSTPVYTDIVFWDGFEGTITDTTYESTNYDYPAFHTWLLSSATSTCSLSQTTKRVGEKSLYLANCNRDFVAVFPGIDMRNIRFGMWVNSTAISRSLFSVFYSGNKNGYIINLTAGDSITSVKLVATISGLTLPWVPIITTPDRSGWHFYEIALDVFNSSVKVYFDGVEVYSASTSNEPTGTYYFDRISIGALSGVNSNAVVGYFDNAIISTNPNRDLYALALLEACPKTS